MAMKHLLTTLARRRPHRPPAALTATVRSQSTSPAVATSSSSPSLPSPPPPTAMVYDRLAEEVKSKIKRLENPDPRFLKYGSPHPSLTDHSHILTAPETRVTTLPNGLRVATESNLASKTATVGVWIDAGSRFENDETNGTAHFLEHMIFKGTEQRTARDLEEEVENMGGHLNAYTSREQTTYYAKVLHSDVPKALSILADILQNSKFDDDRILRERDVILREMEEVEKQPDEVIFDHLHATAFQYSPLARTILGPSDNIKTISKEHLQNYIKTHYTAPRMVIAASGAIKHEDLVGSVKGLFTKLSGDPATASQLVAEEPSFFTGSEVRIVDDDLPLAHFAVAFSGASWTDPDSIPLMVMQAMLGSWNKNVGGGKHMGSELAQRVAINDIAENYMAFNTNYKDTGLFGVFATAKEDCLDDLAYAIMYEVTKLVYRVSEADVIRARNQLKSSLLLHLDGTSAVAEDIGRQLLTYGRRIPLAEMCARIDSVDASTIKRVANRFIYDRACSAPVTRLGSSAQPSQPQQHLLSFHNCLNRCPIPSLQISGLQSTVRKQSSSWKVQAQLNEVAAEKSPNSVPINNKKSEDGSLEGKGESSSQTNIPDAASISAFMAQVSDLIKLVDSRDIVELEMKQLDLELVIRKKEALAPPPPAPASQQPAQYYSMPPPQPAAAAAAAAPAPAPGPPAPALPAPAKTSTSSHPPLKCPMAGTFYRCPAPGEPPFVKVGDKVQKGQVICIIEAMKLMNEIEADQSGTVAEILVEDTKPVSVDTPLFVIVP
ncbi:unnamed protein product [Malus baccata var. baccata]